MLTTIIVLLASHAAPAAGEPAAASQPPNGTELHGRTTRSIFPDGSVVHMNYRADGTFTGKLGESTWSGNYWLEDGKLCLRTTDEFECWPYAEPMVPGRTYEITAPDGAKVKATLLP